jgi:hypothetical protein
MIRRVIRWFRSDELTVELLIRKVREWRQR